MTLGCLRRAGRRIGEVSAGIGPVLRRPWTPTAYEDEWALAIIYEDVALLAAASGAGESALRLIGAAEALRQRSLRYAGQRRKGACQMSHGSVRKALSCTADEDA